jgi:hypothetical protein
LIDFWTPQPAFNLAVTKQFRTGLVVNGTEAVAGDTTFHVERTTQRRSKDGSVVRYLALAENVRDAEKGYVEARVVHSFGRADELDRAALERLVRSIRRVLDEGAPDQRATTTAKVRKTLDTTGCPRRPSAPTLLQSL